MSNGLDERVRQFNSLQLPGQPLAMHMGTSYLVNDLHRHIKELKTALQAVTKAQDLEEAVNIAYTAVSQEAS